MINLDDYKHVEKVTDTGHLFTRKESEFYIETNDPEILAILAGGRDNSFVDKLDTLRDRAFGYEFGKWLRETEVERFIMTEASKGYRAVNFRIETKKDDLFYNDPRFAYAIARRFPGCKVDIIDVGTLIPIYKAVISWGSSYES